MVVTDNPSSRNILSSESQPEPLAQSKRISLVVEIEDVMSLCPRRKVTPYCWQPNSSCTLWEDTVQSGLGEWHHSYRWPASGMHIQLRLFFQRSCTLDTRFYMMHLCAIKIWITVMHVHWLTPWGSLVIPCTLTYISMCNYVRMLYYVIEEYRGIPFNLEWHNYLFFA